MRVSRTVWPAALLLCAVCGCGTVGNLSHFSQAQMFGGTWRDMLAAQDLYGEAGSVIPKTAEDWGRYIVATPFLLVDLPLSLAADTATLPLTLPLSLYRAAHPESAFIPNNNPSPTPATPPPSTTAAAAPAAPSQP